MLKLMVLQILHDDNYTGYNLIKKIKEKTGFWKPSPGSIYPLMKSLSKKKLITYKKKGNQKIYSLTKQGKIYFKKLEAKKQQLIKELSDGMKLYKLLCEDSGELQVMDSMLKQIEKGNFPVKSNFDTIVKFKKILIKSIRADNNNKEINKILGEATKKLEKLESKN